MTMYPEIEDISLTISSELQKRGFKVDEGSLSPEMVGFLMSTRFMRSECFARTIYDELLSYLSVEVVLIDNDGSFPHYFTPGLFHFCNLVTDTVYGISLVLHIEENENSGESDQSLILSSGGYLLQEEDLPVLLEQIMDRIQHVVDRVFPTLIAYLSQKPVVIVNEERGHVFSRLKLPMHEAIKMARYERFGTA